MLNIQMQITGINHMSQYIHIENTLDDISQFVLYFWSNISAALVSRRDQALLLASGVLYVVWPVVSTVSGQDRCHIAGNAIQSLSEVKSGKDAVVWLSIKAVFVLWSLGPRVWSLVPVGFCEHISPLTRVSWWPQLSSAVPAGRINTRGKVFPLILWCWTRLERPSIFRTNRHVRSVCVVRKNFKKPLDQRVSTYAILSELPQADTLSCFCSG